MFWRFKESFYKKANCFVVHVAYLSRFHDGWKYGISAPNRFSEPHVLKIQI
jgi:hypothetical protein